MHMKLGLITGLVAAASATSFNPQQQLSTQHQQQVGKVFVSRSNKI